MRAVRQTLSNDRVRLSIVCVIDTPQKLQNALDTKPAITNKNNVKFENICNRYTEGSSMNASPWLLYTHLLPMQGQGMNDNTKTIMNDRIVPYTPSHPTISNGLTLYQVSNFCSQAQRKPLNTKDTIIKVQPTACVLVYSAELLLGFAFSQISASPTMIRPIIAIPHPIKCLLLSSMRISHREKIKVVMMLAPLSIMQVDPEIIAKAEHCSITEKRSDTAGIMKIVGEYFSFVTLPYLQYRKSKHKDSPIKKVKPCRYG